jgi:hypothetical protein
LRRGASPENGIRYFRPPNHHVIELAGRMETELTAARLVHRSMLAAAGNG